jgi:hypothetical protein
MIDFYVEVTEQVASLMVPYPPHVVGYLIQTLQFLWQGSLYGQHSPLRNIGIACFDLHHLFVFVFYLSAFSLDAQFVEHIDESRVETLVGADALRERYVYNLIHTVAHHDVALSLDDGLNGAYTHAAGQDAVAGRGRPATLEMAQDGDAYIELGELVPYTVGIV